MKTNQMKTRVTPIQGMLLSALLASPAAALASSAAEGVDFWLTFPAQPVSAKTAAEDAFQLKVFSEKNTVGTISVSSLGFRKQFTVDANTTATVTLPPASNPALTGIHADHAYVVLDAATGFAELVSEPVGLDFLP